MNFLLWNIGRRPLADTIRRLVVQHDVDILVLVESNIAPGAVVQALNADGPADFDFSPSQCLKVQLYHRFSSNFVTPIFEGHRFSIREVSLPLMETFLLAVAHLPDKRNFRDGSQTQEAFRFAEEIRKAETEVGHRRTVLVGDLNMNPFEEGIVGTEALHGVMTRAIAARGERRVQGRLPPMFYNPTWKHFGAGEEEPPGTYYSERYEGVCYFWNLFDQVLIRPTLIPFWRDRSFRILSKVGDDSLLNRRGVPDRQRYSDHLPIVFELDFPQGVAL
jgi:exonuclease III